jgi:hypothetical protein
MLKITTATTTDASTPAGRVWGRATTVSLVSIIGPVT